MSTAKRRINSTGRRKITRDHVDLRMLNPKPDEALAATMALKLDDLSLPPSAAIVVEGYHRSTSMRFDCGTVGAKKIPDLLRLNELDQTGTVLFRIKVVDTDGDRGRILASAERLRPQSENEESGRRSLFPILERDLGPELWRVEISEAGPALILNYRITGFTYRILENPFVQGIILPAALRTVLEVLADDPSDAEDDEDGWKADWLKFCSAELNVIDDPAELGAEERLEWIRDGVRRFCQNMGFVEKTAAMQPGEHFNA